MRIKRIDSGLLHSNMYVVVDNGHAIIIDPCKNIDGAAELVVDYIIVTHEHYDHISGVNEWKQATGAPLICSKACAAGLKDPRKNMSRYFDVFCEMQTWVPIDSRDIEAVEYSCQADMTFEDSARIDWQEHVIRLVALPGHSAGSIGIVLDETDFFSGDSLLENLETELRFPGGSKKKWSEIGKPRTESLADGKRVWPGHFDSFFWHRPPESFAEEKTANVVLFE